MCHCQLTLICEGRDIGGGLRVGGSMSSLSFGQKADLMFIAKTVMSFGLHGET